MAKATYAPMFETVSGALNKIDKKSPHAADQKMVLTTHRKAPTTSPDCSRVYLRDLNSVSRSTLPTNKELNNRERFATISAAVQERMKDLTKIASDQAAFLAQKNSSDGKTTMRSYLWSLEAASYDEEHQG